MQQGSVLTLKGWEYSPLNFTRNTQQGPYPATQIVLATPFWPDSMLDGGPSETGNITMVTMSIPLNHHLVGG
jgi:hypothetical protein